MAVDPAGAGRDVKQDERAERIPRRERFGRARRVRSGLDFQRIRRRGRQVSGRYLALGYVRRHEREAPLRAGFIVGKRVGGAVVRNRVKRRLREIVRHTLAALAPGWDIVLTARPAAAAATYAELEAETGELLTRAGLWASPPAGPGPSNAETIRGER